MSEVLGWMNSSQHSTIHALMHAFFYHPRQDIPRQSLKMGRQKSFFPSRQCFSKVESAHMRASEGIYPHPTLWRGTRKSRTQRFALEVFRGTKNVTTPGHGSDCQHFLRVAWEAIKCTEWFSMMKRCSKFNCTGWSSEWRSKMKFLPMTWWGHPFMHSLIP